jgi:hypothetical protein
VPNHKRVIFVLLMPALLSLVTRIVAAIEIEGGFGLTYLPHVVHLALVFLLASLLGFWAVFSQVALWKRLVGFVICDCSVEMLASAGELSSHALLAPSVAAVGTALMLLAARPCGFRLAISAAEGEQPDPRLRYSMDLMILTLVVAVLIAGASLPSAPRFNANLAETIPFVLWGASFVLSALAISWAALEPGPVKARCVFALGFSTALGMACTAAIGSPFRWARFLLVEWTTVLQAALLLTSLLMLRSCGYRLARKSIAPDSRIVNAAYRVISITPCDSGGVSPPAPLP